jgi:hypothetical protein
MNNNERNYEILDRNEDRDGELQSFLIVWDEDGQPELKNATSENVLLYIHGLYEFLNGNEGVVLSRDPDVMVAPTGNEYSYLLNVSGHTVETMPNQSAKVLDGVKRAVENNDTSKLKRVHQEIVSNQVRKSIINVLLKTFSADERSRISVESAGWVVDGHYLINWEAGLYTVDKIDATTYEAVGGVSESDSTGEFVKLRQSKEIEPADVVIDGQAYQLTEREMTFLAKVKWILHREHYHPDKPFWLYEDKRGGVTDVDEMDEDDKDSSFVPDFG